MSRTVDAFRESAKAAGAAASAARTESLNPYQIELALAQIPISLGNIADVVDRWRRSADVTHHQLTYGRPRPIPEIPPGRSYAICRLLPSVHQSLRDVHRRVIGLHGAIETARDPLHALYVTTRDLDFTL